MALDNHWYQTYCNGGSTDTSGEIDGPQLISSDLYDIVMQGFRQYIYVECIAAFSGFHLVSLCVLSRPIVVLVRLNIADTNTKLLTTALLLGIPHLRLPGIVVLKMINP